MSGLLLAHQTDSTTQEDTSDTSQEDSPLDRSASPEPLDLSPTTTATSFHHTCQDHYPSPPAKPSPAAGLGRRADSLSVRFDSKRHNTIGLESMTSLSNNSSRQGSTNDLDHGRLDENDGAEAAAAATSLDDRSRSLQNQTPDSVMHSETSSSSSSSLASESPHHHDEKVHSAAAAAGGGGHAGPTTLAEFFDEEDDSSDEHEDEFEDEHPPVFNRTYSCPLPARVAKSFARPSASHRPSISSVHHSETTPLLSDGSSTSAPVSNLMTPSINNVALQELSSELSDSLQSAIQTLLHLSPPHLLDNAKEQYSGTTVQFPTTSLSALLTTMKGLNYLSANVSQLCDEPQQHHPSGGHTKSAPSSRHPTLSISDPDGKTTLPAISGLPAPRALARSRPGTPATSAAIAERAIPEPVMEGILDRSTKEPEDFDIGELLQSTADLLGGHAAQAGVEMVLFHGDVGIKHTSLSGDGEGLGYAMSYVTRQILNVCKSGDTIELGLQVIPQSPSLTPRVNWPLTASELEDTKRASHISMEETGMISSGVGDTSLEMQGEESTGPLLCTLEIVHTFKDESEQDAMVATPRPDDMPPPPSGSGSAGPRQEPSFDGLLCRRILSHVHALLRKGESTTDESSYFATARGQTAQSRTYELSVLLARGEPMDDNKLTAEEESVRQPFPQFKLDREPTLAELSHFATTSLRGKRVELHASLLSVFARHLTSYLAAWGMEISHIPIEEEVQEVARQSKGGSSNASASPSNPSEAASQVAAQVDTEPISGLATLAPDDNGGGGGSSGVAQKSPQRFILIDDDVFVLKRQLLKVRAELNQFKLRPKTTKRPTLAGRTRSKRQLRSATSPGGLNSLPMADSPTTISTAIIHFTSLFKYNQVRDIVTSICSSPTGSNLRSPEVIVIPKPVGPRRLLTALHTAVQRPVLDPFFTPIASSPRSPSGGYFPPFTPKLSGGGTGGHVESPLRTMHGNDYLGHDFSVHVNAAGGGGGGAPIASSSSSTRRPDQSSPSFEHSPGASNVEGSLNITTPAGGYLATPAGSYFAGPSPQGRVSGATGYLLSDPSGQHMGVLFDPSSKGSNSSSSSSKPVNRSPSGGSKSELARRANSSSAGNRTARSMNEQGENANDTVIMPMSPTRRLSEASTSSSMDQDEDDGDVSQVQRPVAGAGATAAPDPTRRGEEEQQRDGGPDSSSPPSPEAHQTRVLKGRRTYTGASEASHAPQGDAGGASTAAAAPGAFAATDATSDTASPTDRPLMKSYPSDTSSHPEALTVQQVTEMVSSPAVQDMSERASRRMQALEARKAMRRKEEAEAASASKSLKAGKASKSSTVVPPINVLIVEDNPINQNILSMFLRKRKIKHQAANNGQEAVEKWKTGTFHLILMDIQLPVMDGIEATKLIRASERDSNIGFFPSTPGTDGGHKTLSPSVDTIIPATPLRSSVIIVALTASSFHQDRVNALAAGCNDFLTKPVSLKWLESKIVEWGCMQALIDFEGWRRWKSNDARDRGIREAKKALQTHSAVNAKIVADKLQLPSKVDRRALSDDEKSGSENPTPQRVSSPPPAAGPSILLTEATPDSAHTTEKIRRSPLSAAHSEVNVSSKHKPSSDQAAAHVNNNVNGARDVLAELHQDASLTKPRHQHHERPSLSPIQASPLSTTVKELQREDESPPSPPAKPPTGSSSSGDDGSMTPTTMATMTTKGGDNATSPPPEEKPLPPLPLPLTSDQES